MHGTRFSYISGMVKHRSLFTERKIYSLKLPYAGVAKIDSPKLQLKGGVTPLLTPNNSPL